MEEVIAKKDRYVSKANKFMLATGLIIIILCVIALILYPIVGWRFTFLNDFEPWELKFFISMGFVMGGAITAVSAFMIRRTSRIPEKIITYQNGILKFSDGFTCRIEEVKSVRCNPDVNYGSDTVFDIISMGASTAGTLTVVVGDYERVYKKIENVKDANDRLIQLMLECREKGKDVNG